MDKWMHLCREERKRAIHKPKTPFCPECFGSGIERDPSGLDYVECYHCGLSWPKAITTPQAMSRVRGKVFAR